MKLPKVQIGIERGCGITSSIEITSSGIMPSGWLGDAWGWVKKKGCRTACSVAEEGAKALCSAKGGGAACTFAAEKAGDWCRSKC